MVSNSTAGCIAPRPLNRVISGFARLLTEATILARSAWSSAQGSSLPTWTQERGAGVTALDARRQVSAQEGQHPRRDVVIVAVGVHQEDRATVTEPVLTDLDVHPAAARGDDVRELLVLQRPAAVCPPRVAHPPRMGRITKVLRLRPRFADQPALSASTMRRSGSDGSLPESGWAAIDRPESRGAARPGRRVVRPVRERLVAGFDWLVAV